MRVTITVDSATAEEAFNLTLAFQRSVRGHGPIPQQVVKDPTVQVFGSAMTWTSPALTREQAEAVLEECRSIGEPDPEVMVNEEDDHRQRGLCTNRLSEKSMCTRPAGHGGLVHDNGIVSWGSARA